MVTISDVESYIPDVSEVRIPKNSERNGRFIFRYRPQDLDLNFLVIIRAKFHIKEALSVLMLCAPVFIFTSGSSALLGRPRCGLSI